jgi:hypothetical protein
MKRKPALFAALALLALVAGTVVLFREHSKTIAAFRRESEQRSAAEKSFQEARQAVDAFTELSEQELADNPRMQSVRRRFLETGLAYYREFVEQRHNDPTVGSELATSSERIVRLIDELAAIEGFGRMLLLADARVQRELQLSHDQTSRLNELLSMMDAERQRAVNESGDRDSAVTSLHAGAAVLVVSSADHAIAPTRRSHCRR